MANRSPALRLPSTFRHRRGEIVSYFLRPRILHHRRMVSRDRYDIEPAFNKLPPPLRRVEEASVRLGFCREQYNPTVVRRRIVADARCPQIVQDFLVISPFREILRHRGAGGRCRVQMASSEAAKQMLVLAAS